MTPGMPVPIPAEVAIYQGGADQTREYIEQIKAQDALHKKMASALVNFLRAAFPTAKPEAYELGIAYVDLMTVGSTRQLEMLEQRMKAQASTPQWSSSETLTRLVEQRDQVQDQLNQIRRALEALAESMPEGYADLMESISMAPMKSQLAGIEEQITMVQKAMEGGS